MIRGGRLGRPYGEWGLRFVGQFCTLPSAAWTALLGLGAVISAVCGYVLLRQAESAEEGRKRTSFYGARVRYLALAILIIDTVAMASGLAVLPRGIVPAAQVEWVPTATPTVSPTATPTASPGATRTLSPTATPTLSPTFTPTSSLTPAPTLSSTVASTSFPTGTPTPGTEAALRRVAITGELNALKRDGEIGWSAVRLQCWNATGEELGRVGLMGLDGTYLLPAGTVRVQLWVGSELGGTDWWRDWDSRPADATSPEITLVIARVKREAPSPMPPPTLVPTEPPTAVPAATPSPCPP